MVRVIMKNVSTHVRGLCRSFCFRLTFIAKVIVPSQSSKCKCIFLDRVHYDIKPAFCCRCFCLAVFESEAVSRPTKCVNCEWCMDFQVPHSTVISASHASTTTEVVVVMEGWENLSAEKISSIPVSDTQRMAAVSDCRSAFFAVSVSIYIWMCFPFTSLS